MLQNIYYFSFDLFHSKIFKIAMIFNVAIVCLLELLQSISYMNILHHKFFIHYAIKGH